MESLRPILADSTINNSEFKKNPMAVVMQADILCGCTEYK
jgi:hypothetical protein